MTPHDDDKVDWDAYTVLASGGVDPLTALAGSIKDREPRPRSKPWAVLFAAVVFLVVLLWLTL